MIVRVIEFTPETIPMIYDEYPALNGRWDNSGIFLATEEKFYFVYDKAYDDHNKYRVINKDHFEDVYEIDASEITNTFKWIY